MDGVNINCQKAAKGHKRPQKISKGQSEINQYSLDIILTVSH